MHSNAFNVNFRRQYEKSVSPPKVIVGMGEALSPGPSSEQRSKRPSYNLAAATNAYDARGRRRRQYIPRWKVAVAIVHDFRFLKIISNRSYESLLIY